MPHNPTKIIFPSQHLSDESLANIVTEFIDKNLIIDTVDVHNNELKGEGMMHACYVVIQQHQQLHPTQAHLNFSDNPITTLDHIGQVLRNATVKTLVLDFFPNVESAEFDGLMVALRKSDSKSRESLAKLTILGNANFDNERSLLEMLSSLKGYPKLRYMRIARFTGPTKYIRRALVVAQTCIADAVCHVTSAIARAFPDRLRSVFANRVVPQDLEAFKAQFPEQFEHFDITNPVNVIALQFEFDGIVAVDFEKLVIPEHHEHDPVSPHLRTASSLEFLPSQDALARNSHEAAPDDEKWMGGHGSLSGAVLGSPVTPQYPVTPHF